MSKNILIIGSGYVGIAYSCLLSNNNNVHIFDNDEKKVQSLKNGKKYFSEDEIRKCLKKNKKNINFISNISNYDYDFIFLCLPTDYDPASNQFNTSIVENYIYEISKSDTSAIVVIKSTVPVGFTNKSILSYGNIKILFSPEFLREGHAIHDTLNPERVIAGGEENLCIRYFNLIKGVLKTNIPYLKMSHTEAESVKLFSNTYLAMRVAFFNELDTFCIQRNLNAKNIIKGVSLDKRIRNIYNNPSFGYGGYCLPKDTKQLLSNYEDVPQDLISSIIKSNETRKKFIVEKVTQNKPKTVGIYRLAMKKGSDNFRESSILDIINFLKRKKINVVIYEPNCTEGSFIECKVENDFPRFVETSSLILVNRLDNKIKKYQKIIFSRDLFNEN